MSSGIKIKVCGITQMEQFKELNTLGVDYVGFIFYPQSKRYAGESRFNQSELLRLKTNAKVTAVFVNPTMEDIKTAVSAMPNISTIQLHGNESPILCNDLKKKYTIIKAFNVDDDFNFTKTITPYKNCVDYFLFDTKTPDHGGSGIKFDWSIFKNIVIGKPFFLSGGISNDDIKAIQSFKHPHFYGIDINSKFEIEPGIKNIQLVAQFVTAFKK
jgi:phosphoribosylanthranilate isomerase